MATNELTKLQGALAVASFSAGVAIACVCLFLVHPRGEISNSAISIVSELLVLAGAILGVKTSFDVKLNKMQAEIRHKVDKTDDFRDENSRVETDEND